MLLKPAIRSALASGLLTVAVQPAYERSVDRKGLAQLAKSAMKAPAINGAHGTSRLMCGCAETSGAGRSWPDKDELWAQQFCALRAPVPPL